MSYKQLAEENNTTIEKYLLEYIDYREQAESVLPDTKNKFQTDMYYWVVASGIDLYCFSHWRARDNLRVFGFEEDEIDNLFSTGIENIKNGEPAFKDGFPISEFKIREKIRTYRKTKTHQSIVKHFLRRWVNPVIISPKAIVLT